MVQIWEGHARTGKRLGPIIPIVIYHGEREWVRGGTMEQLLNYPPELQAFAVSFSFPLPDLWKTTTQIGEDAFLQTLLAVQKYARSAEFSKQMEAIFKLLALDYHMRGQMDHITDILEYIMSVNPSVDTAQFQNALKSVLPVDFYPGTLAEKFYNEGEALGKLEGRLTMLQEIAGLPVSTDQELALLSVAELEQEARDIQSTPEFQQAQQWFRERHQTPSLKNTIQ